MQILACIYYSHIIISTAFIVYTYTFLPRARFQQIRRTMATCNFLAFTVLTMYRTMPPRLLPKRFGFVDILHPSANDDAGSVWSHNKFQLTIAAMPSLHFGMSAFIAYSLLRWAPHAWVRGLAVLWPVAMLLTILATANHFLLDAVVGVLVPVVAWQISDVLLLLRPMEEWVFWVLRTKKPETADQDPSFLCEYAKLIDAERID